MGQLGCNIISNLCISSLMIQFKYGNNLDIFSLLYHINEKSVHKQTKTGRLSILASDIFLCDIFTILDLNIIQH